MSFVYQLAGPAGHAGLLSPQTLAPAFSFYHDHLPTEHQSALIQRSPQHMAMTRPPADVSFDFYDSPIPQYPKPSVLSTSAPQTTDALPPEANKTKRARQSRCTQSEPVRTVHRTSHKIHMSDKDEVLDFLRSRFQHMQQLAVKKIAKNWIKGICPKKQTRFPYYDHKDKPKKGSHGIPEWWPAAGCAFREPDHIRKIDRMLLCLHLLTLRPSPEQLQAWNNSQPTPRAAHLQQLSCDTHPTHVQKGWTAFLRELAGEEVFVDLPEKNEKIRQQRRRCLQQLYEVAELQEKYFNGELTYKEAFYDCPAEDILRKTNAKRKSDILDDSDHEVDHEREKRPRKKAKTTARTPQASLDLGLKMAQEFMSSIGSRRVSASLEQQPILFFPQPTATLDARSQPTPCHSASPACEDRKPLLQNPAAWRKQELEAAAAAADVKHLGVGVQQIPSTKWAFVNGKATELPYSSDITHLPLMAATDPYVVYAPSPPVHPSACQSYPTPNWDVPPHMPDAPLSFCGDYPAAAALSFSPESALTGPQTPSPSPPQTECALPLLNQGYTGVGQMLGFDPAAGSSPLYHRYPLPHPQQQQMLLQPQMIGGRISPPLEGWLCQGYEHGY